MSNPAVEDENDVEVFFGKITRRELLHLYGRLNVNYNRQTICSSRISEDEGNTSIKIIEQNSEPDIIIPESPDKIKPCLYRNSTNSETGEDSFLKIEKMVSELDLSSKNKIFDDLNNTMDVVDLILKKGNVKTENESIQESDNVDHEAGTALLSPKKDTNLVALGNILSNQDILKPTLSPASQYCTPIKEDKKDKTEIFNTPTNKLLDKTPCFKTPANPVSSKKSSYVSLKKTLLKPPSYQHIASPVAAYIKYSPQVPLIKNVLPKKPLAGCSSIPKLVKPKSVTNKENIVLPSLAYKSAKTTKVIDVPEKDKLPQSHWAKKVTSSLPKPTVLKHDRREIKSCRKPLQSNQEDSFANLSLRQADVSLCTQKSAFDKP